jgi:hypothetical protein
MSTSQIISYPSPTIARADLALRCSPFGLPLLVDMQADSISLGQITGTTGVDRGYSFRPLSELGADSHLQWLMQVGILRREVDGQGLTDRFRLTPLGLQLSTQWTQNGNRIPPAGFFDRVTNFINRWLRWPI